MEKAGKNIKTVFGALLGAALFILPSYILSAADLFPGYGAVMSAESADAEVYAPRLLISTPSFPAGGSYLNSRSISFTWTGVSTSAAANLQGAQYDLQVDDAADFLTPEAAASLPLIALSTVSPTADASVSLSIPALADSTTYYWRVRVARGGSGGPWSSTASFTADYTPPSASGFAYKSSTGGWLSEGQVVTLASGVTAQAVLTDAVSGLSVVPGSGGYSVKYSTDGGDSWISEGMAVSRAGSEIAASAMAVYNGKLYVGMGGNTWMDKIMVYDGSSWSVSRPGSPVGQAIYSLAVYKGKLYAGAGYAAGQTKIFVFDGISWTTAYTCPSLAASGYVAALAVYNEKLYAGVSGSQAGEGDVYVFDGYDWKLSYAGAHEAINTMAAYNGKLYAGQGYGAGDGDVLVYDGSAWGPAYDGASSNIYALGVYNGKLYAGQGSNVNGDGDVLSFDGISWTLSYNGSASRITSLLSHNGLLYAAQAGNSLGAGDVYTYDGRNWRKEFDGAQGGIYALASYNGRWYAGQGARVGFSDLASDIFGSYSLFGKAVTAADGSTGYETITSTSLVFAQSRNTAVCGGAAPCQATNQIVFNASDRAGNVLSYGPYAVLLDYVSGSQLAVTTPTWPADGSRVGFRRPNFGWIGVSTNTASVLGPQAQYIVDYSVNPDFSGAVTLSTPVVLGSTSDFTADGTVAPGTDLADGAVYYWRVRLRTGAGNYASNWSTNSFTTDFSAPTVSGYQVVSGTGGFVSESQWIGLAGGVTAQAVVQDDWSGLAVSTSALWSGGDGHDWGDLTGGYSVSYTTTAGAGWVEGAGWDVSNGGNAVSAGENYVNSLAVYNGKLYAGTGTGGKVAVFDGNTWSAANGGNAVTTGVAYITSLAVYNGKLYAGTDAVAKVVVFDGNTWSATNGGNALIVGELQIQSLAVYNGKLYAGTYPNGKVAVFDGNTWSATNGGNALIVGELQIQSLAVYNGKLYAGTYPNGK
ncbi:MAG: hypothetical protein PHV36_14685, partial [Elusimicrobiales bacterium]|nr:hypothetical protein [Elusimicrobiales bacterium]